MIVAQEEAILKAEEQFQQMVRFVKQAGTTGLPIEQVEQNLWDGVLQMGLAFMKAFVAGEGPGDLGETIEKEGRTLRRLEQLHTRRYVAVFGELPIERFVYGTRETQKHEMIPLDARLGLPDSDFSVLLQKWDLSLCVKQSYAEARQSIEQILGVGQSVRTLEQMISSTADYVREFRDQQEVPTPDQEGSIVVLTADCKGVPMRNQEGAHDNGHRRHVPKEGQEGKKAGHKRMACVGSVYTIDPFVRTAEDIVDEVMNRRRKKDRPKPQNKLLRAELTRLVEGVELNGKDEIFAWFSEQVELRHPDGGQPVVCVMDGERGLWTALTRHLEGVIGILDIFHVLKRLWQAAHCFYGEGSQAAADFVTERLKRLLEGRVGRVIGGLRQMATKQGVRGKARKTLREVIGYFSGNRKFMQYDQYLAAGYPIGSGVAEGACGHLVKDRMEQAGMRWRVAGAQSMLDLRAIHLNGEWDSFHTFRIEAERERLYPYRSWLESQWPMVA
jgi:hypothetical protein